jgi:1-acyl-sn-glycerol-3-phosphate acyltransferase
MSVQLPGGRPPDKRLPISAWSWTGARAVIRRRIRTSSTFPFGSPPWPGTVESPPVDRNLGVYYDSDWARSPVARAARTALQTAIANPILRAVTSPTVRGLDRLGHFAEPAIFAANHSSHLDAPLILSVIPTRWRDEMFVAGAADYFFDTHPKAVLSALALNAVPMERQRVSRTSAGRATQLLDDGWSMLIFPEGGRSPDGWGQPHRPGAAWLAVRSSVPVVPLYLEGTARILPKGSRRPTPGHVTVNFGAPIFPPSDGDSRTFAHTIENAIAGLADELAGDWYSARRRAATGATPPLSGPDATPWRRSWALGQGRSGVGPKGGGSRWPWNHRP